MDPRDGEEADMQQVTLAYGRGGLPIELPDDAAVITATAPGRSRGS
jgi:hypothetical protein